MANGLLIFLIKPVKTKLILSRRTDRQNLYGLLQERKRTNIKFYGHPTVRKYLWSDRRQRLRYIDIDSKKITDVVQSPVWEFRQYNWSPDSKWITYSKPEEETMSKVYIYSLSSAKSFPVTEGWYSSSDPSI